MRWDRHITIDGEQFSEEDFLALNIKNYTVDELSSLLGRTYDSVVHKASRLGYLTRDFKQPGLELVPLQNMLLKALNKGVVTVNELSKVLDRSDSTILQLVKDLRARGYEINLEEDKVSIPRIPIPTGNEIDLTQYYKNSIKLALYSCTHFGNRWQQPTNLHAFYKICEDQKVDVFIHHGDGVDGTKMYKGQEQEQFAIGLDEQEDLWVELQPKSDVSQYVGGGNHDYSWVKYAGANAVKRVCAKRDDLIYTGMQDAKFLVGDKVLYKFLHFRGGTSYALSYRIQRLNEALGREEDNPQVFGIGGQHVAALLPDYLGITSLMTGCFEGRTPYLQGKGLYPDIGGWILEMWLRDDGNLARIKSEFISFEEIENDY